MHISHNPYWITKQGIKTIEKMRDAIYMGPWCIKTANGDWSDEPVEIFYVENPDTSKGHSHYFGIFYKIIISGMEILRGDLMITRGDSAFSEPIKGILGPRDEVFVSRYRHDFIQISNESFIDGGRSYLRLGGNSKIIEVTIEKSEFKFKEILE